MYRQIRKRLALSSIPMMLVTFGACALIDDFATPSGGPDYRSGLFPSTSENIEASVDWIEPEWMASHRATGQAYQDALYNCIVDELQLAREATGLVLNARPSRWQSGWDIGVFITPDANGTPPETFEIVDGVQDTCRERFPRPDFGGDEANHELYSRMLDTRACLIAHGFEIPDPPPEDTWVSTGGRWTPLERLPQTVQISELGSRLMEACPQSGPNWFAGAAS